MKQEIPDYNFFQIAIIKRALETLDLGGYDDGYKEVHKHLLERFTKLYEEYKQ
jgi:hypothetical protein